MNQGTRRLIDIFPDRSSPIIPARTIISPEQTRDPSRKDNSEIVSAPRAELGVFVFELAPASRQLRSLASTPAAAGSPRFLPRATPAHKDAISPLAPKQESPRVPDLAVLAQIARGRAAIACEKTLAGRGNESGRRAYNSPLAAAPGAPLLSRRAPLRPTRIRGFPRDRADKKSAGRAKRP